MKKIVLLVIAALSASITLAAGVASANIVGYLNSDKKGKQYVPFGACFAGVGNGQRFKLGDIKLAGGSCGTDNIQVIDSDKASVSAKYCYIDESEAIGFGDISYTGWWTFPEMDKRADDIELDIGSGFLANFGTKGVSIQFAGQVTGDGIVMDCIGKQYLMVCGIVPRAFKLGEMILLGSSCGTDNIQVIDPDAAKVSHKYCYVSESEAIGFGSKDYVGWYNFPEIDVPVDAEEFDAGTAFLSNFGTKNVSVFLPSAVK